MRVDRLERFSDLLARDAANTEGVKFDMSYWAKVAGEDRYSFVDGAVPTLDCGTNACALGLAAISGEFEDDGLSYEIDSGALEPTFEGLTGFEAGQEFFGISKRDAMMLFDPYFYPFSLRQGAMAEHEVIRRIKLLIADGNLSSIG